MTFFASLSTMLDSVIDKVSPQLITPFIDAIRPAAVIGISLYFIWLILPLVTGKGNDTVDNIFKKVLVWSIVWTFAFNGDGWLGAVNSGVNEVYDWAAGSTSIYQSLDSNLVSINKTARALFAKDDADWVPLEGFLAMTLVLVSYYTFAFISVAMLILSKVVLNLLLLILPFAILAILFPTIKSVFSQWMQLFLENTFTVLFLNVLFKIVEGELTLFVTKANKLAEDPTEGNIILLGANVSLAITLMILFIIISRMIASKLAAASMNSELSIPGYRKQ